VTEGQKWLKALMAEQQLNVQQMQLAKLAAKQLDTAEAAEKAAKKNPSVKGKYGPKPNPQFELARRAGDAFIRLCRAVKVAGEEKRHVGRPSLQDETWKRQQSKQQEAQKPDEWSDFDLPTKTKQ
jgi:hypothetical protein